MTKIVYFPSTNCRLRERTKREIYLLWEEQQRWYALHRYRDATERAWAQVRILNWTTQSEAESLHLLRHHPFNAGRRHENDRENIVPLEGRKA